MVWKKIERSNETFKFDKVGASVTGILRDTRADVGKYENTVYDLELADGKVVAVWGATILDDLMARVKVGQKVRITYLGDVPTKNGKGKDAKNFSVEIEQ